MVGKRCLFPLVPFLPWEPSKSGTCRKATIVLTQLSLTPNRQTWVTYQEEIFLLSSFLIRSSRQSLRPGFCVMTIQPVPTPSCPQGPLGTSRVSPTAQISCRPTSQRCWERTHTGSSRSLWSPGKCLWGRMQVSGWKCCADGDCWAASVQDRGSSTNHHQCPCWMWLFWLT